MNDYLADDELRDKNKPKPPSTNRVVVWVILGAVGLYYVVSGIIGIVNGS